MGDNGVRPFSVDRAVRGERICVSPEGRVNVLFVSPTGSTGHHRRASDRDAKQAGPGGGRRTEVLDLIG